jgi:hypothetical protein
MKTRSVVGLSYSETRGEDREKCEEVGETKVSWFKKDLGYQLTCWMTGCP